MTEKFEELLMYSPNYEKGDTIALSFFGNEFTYNLMDMATALEIRNEIIKEILNLKEEHGDLCEIEIQSAIEYVILSVCTSLPLKEISINEYFKYRTFVPYNAIKEFDVNIGLLEDSIKRAITEAFIKTEDLVGTLAELASGEMFTELKDKESLETKEVEK